MATFVLVHGGWDGGWAWRSVAAELLTAGHEVYRPSLTGHGERAHLASRLIDLDTYVLDIVNLLLYEALRDVILVGLSLGGMVITGAAERVPERIRHLVYLDALVPEDGQSIADITGPEMMNVFKRAAETMGDGWLVPHEPDEFPYTGVPLGLMMQPLEVTNPESARLKRTLVLQTGKPADSWLTPLMDGIAARVRDEGWECIERPFGHAAYIDQSHDVAELLLEMCQDG